jgi:hypothetical protein
LRTFLDGRTSNASAPAGDRAPRAARRAGVSSPATPAVVLPWIGFVFDIGAVVLVLLALCALDD